MLFAGKHGGKRLTPSTRFLIQLVMEIMLGCASSLHHGCLTDFDRDRLLSLILYTVYCMFQFIVAKNGFLGMTFEHSTVDASPLFPVAWSLQSFMWVAFTIDSPLIP